MKINQTMGALALGLCLATVAQAQPTPGYTPIYITGSTAFRAQIFGALAGELGLTVQQGGVSGNNSFTFQGNVHDADSLGNITAIANVEVLCDFSGSAEGVQTIIQGISTSYLNAGATTSAGSFLHNGADLAFSDVGQLSTPFPYPAYEKLTEVQIPGDAMYPPFTGMAVQPFTFAVNKTGATDGINNITSFNFLDLFVAGTQDLAFYTCTPPGVTTVYAVGRYNLSGTRIGTVLDDGGKTVNSLHQYALSPNGSSTPGLNNGDSSTPNGTQWADVGNSGYFTGGNVGLALANGSTNTSTPPAIGYIGWADAQGKFKTTGAVPINWNGQVPFFGTYPTAVNGNWNICGVENGSYDFWTYERLYELPGDTTTVTTFATDLIYGVQNEIVTVVPQTADIEANMNVYRNVDGGDVQ